MHRVSTSSLFHYLEPLAKKLGRILSSCRLHNSFTRLICCSQHGTSSLLHRSLSLSTSRRSLCGGIFGTCAFGFVGVFFWLCLITMRCMLIENKRGQLGEKSEDVSGSQTPYIAQYSEVLFGEVAHSL